ncbi:replication enhancer protein [Begomovirus andrographis]|uniref:Replication enhancer n=1 Tax=Begomovirus andrographis TaxID=1738045 RepID=A0A088T1G4_9GEMI|nr:replication enhancer protein [Andrographis yellow vein leaf curl virus]AIO11239.1 replication enhancer protein [Andrographis yellow vein leaf curl virus]
MDSRTGESITAAQAENGAYIWEIQNPLYFKIIQHHNRPFLMNHDIINIRIQFNHNLRKALGIHKCFLGFRIFTRLHPQTGRFLRVFKTQVLRYLDNLGVISLNNCIRTFRHVLEIVMEDTIDVEMPYDIKYKLY